jgi:ATP-dependent Clp protease ATP-binding subunit ClpX
MRECAFCGKPKNEVKQLLETDRSAICNKCVASAVQAMGGEAPVAAKKKEEKPLLRPKEIMGWLDQFVISQDKAKRDISVAVYNHYKRREALRKGLVMAEELGKVEIQKSNVLLLGPSGTGKTEIARAISRMLGVPFYVADATRMTQAGYVGDDVESMLQGLIGDAGGDIERAEWGIIFVDEIDKLARKSGRSVSGSRDVTGEGVQQALLKLVEGSKVIVPRGLNKFVGDRGADVLDTTNILFVCAGSFAGIEDVVRRRVNKAARIGFGDSAGKKDLDTTEVYLQIIEEDILEFGMIPELMGRLPVLTTTLPMTEDELVRVLTEPKNALVTQFKALMAMDGISLVFEVEALKAIGREAQKRPTGARALRSILEDLLRDYVFEHAGDPTVQAIQITQDVVERRAGANIVRVTEKPEPSSPKMRTS